MVANEVVMLFRNLVVFRRSVSAAGIVGVREDPKQVTWKYLVERITWEKTTKQHKKYI